MSLYGVITILRQDCLRRGIAVVLGAKIREANFLAGKKFALMWVREIRLVPMVHFLLTFLMNLKWRACDGEKSLYSF